MHKNIKAKTTTLVILLVTTFLLSAFAGLPFIATANAAGYTETVGTLDGVNYVVRFPDNWNGRLVVICRGYSTNPVLNPRTALYNLSTPDFMNRGYACAASQFAPTGFCVQQGVNSTYQLTKYLVNKYNITGKIFLLGASMGGGIALLLGEKYPNLYSGVLDEYGFKDLKDQYQTKARWSNLSDAALTAELTALTSPVPPPTYSNLTSFRTYLVSTSALFENETGGTPATKPKAYEDDSPTYHANISIPVITVQGTSDAIVPLYESVMYQTAVANAGRSNLYRLYPVVNATHASLAVGLQTAARFDELVTWSDIISQGWASVTDARGVKAYPDLREYIWQKNATMPPNGQYDKIGLHRLVKTGITPKGVIFITACPMWGVGEQRISNPPGDNWTKYENYSQAIYWANRGFDVYAIDYRSHFIPTSLNSSQVSFMADWGWDQWISDIKEAANKVKEVSGSSKFFIAGECSGAEAALNYATKYWKDDLRGIILLDANFLPVAGYPIVGTLGTETNTYNLTQTINNMKTSGTFAYTPTLTLTPTLAAYALQNPGAPAEYPPGTPLTPTINPMTNKTWTNITEYVTYTVQYNTPAYPGMYANLMGGYGNVTQFEYFDANRDFLPNRLTLETAAMADWVNCPYLSYDWNDHYKEINVPVLAFATGLFMNRTGTFRFVNGINNTDFTTVMLKNYGHTDVYYGTYSARDVSEPAYQWMVSHYPQLTASASPASVTVETGLSVTFTVKASGTVAPYTYQWYQGTTLLKDQTSSRLSLATTKYNEGGEFPYRCVVTDAEGKTVESNKVYLKVAAPAEEESKPAKQTTPTPTPTPEPSPPPTPEPTPPTPTPPTTSSGTAFALPTEVYAVVIVIVLILAVSVALVLRKRAK